MDPVTYPGKMIILSAPSGAGKSTVANHLLTQQDLRLEFSVSACSREKRNGEKEGREYYFLSVDEFREKIRNREFIEWEEVYRDHYYGTLRSELERIWEKKHHILFDVDVQGGLNLKKMFGSRALALFVMPPSLEVLAERLRKRNTDAEDKIEKRLAKAVEEMKYAGRFDHIIVNDRLEKALSEVVALVRNFLQA